MSEQDIETLYEKLTAETNIEDDFDDPNQEDADDTPSTVSEKLTGKQVKAGFSVLAFLLLTFFIGMRWIDRKAQRIDPPSAAEQTIADIAEENTDKINLNTATFSELKKLRGIGDKRAQAIIDYRNEFGPFTSIDELTLVDGIGDGIFEAIKYDVCV